MSTDYKAQFIAEVNKAMQTLDVKLDGTVFSTLGKQTGARASYVAVGSATVIALFILFGFGQNALCNLVGFSFPLYESFKALQHKDRIDDCDHWLTYWMVYGTFIFVESFTNALTLWIPFYHVFKIVFFFWLFLPQTRGAEAVYGKVLAPVLDKWEVKIDKGIVAAERIAEAAAEDEIRDVGDKARKSIMGAVRSAEQQITRQVIKEVLHEKLGDAAAPEDAPAPHAAPSAPSPQHSPAHAASSPAHARQPSGHAALSPSAPEGEHEHEHLGEEGELIQKEHVEGAHEHDHDHDHEHHETH